MADMGGNSMKAAEKRTNVEMAKMGMAPMLKPKASRGSMRASAHKPKAMRNYSRSK